MKYSLLHMYCYFYHKEFVKSLDVNQTLWTVPNFEISNFDLSGAFIIPSCRLSSHMTGYAGSRDNVVTPQFPQTIPNIPLKNRLRPSRKSFVWVTCYMLIVRNPHRILARGSESIFQLDPETWRTPSNWDPAYPVKPRPGVPRQIYI